MSDRSFIESWSLNFDDIAYVEGFNGSGLTCARCHRSSTRTSTPMTASRSISTGALTSRERPHERHDGYTRNDGTNEHAVPSFPCSFRVVSGLMDNPCQEGTPKMNISCARIGYARVSTADQSLDAQMAAL